MATVANPIEVKKQGMQAFATLGVALLLAVAGYCALFVAPTERTMGLIQRIFYFHVPFGWTAFVAFFISFVASIAYLRSRAPKWDWLAVSAAEVGVPFVTVMLVTGPIWAHPVWGIWWTWDARLTSTFVLWVLYVCYLLLRSLIDEPERRAALPVSIGHRAPPSPLRRSPTRSGCSAQSSVVYIRGVLRNQPGRIAKAGYSRPKAQATPIRSGAR